MLTRWTHALQIAAAAALTLLVLPSWSQDIYRCATREGRVEYQDFPCDATGRSPKTVPVPQRPKPRQIAPLRGTGTSDLDGIARSQAGAAGTFEVEVAHKDELFVINGERYKAVTYCLGTEKGDRVRFLEGNALGVCAKATLQNLRTGQVCDVWCE